MWRVKEEMKSCAVPAGLGSFVGIPSAYALGYSGVAAIRGWIVVIRSVADT